MGDTSLHFGVGTRRTPLYPHSPLYPRSLPPCPSSPSPSAPLPFPHSHGTTTLAFVFRGGIVAAADTRSSCSGLVACPASAKVLPVHSHLVGTTSGTSADCMLWKRILARECRLYRLRHRRRLPTGGAAKLLSHMLHPFKGTELCVAATLGGWDGDGGEGGEGWADSEEEKVGEASGEPEGVGETQTDRGGGGGGGGEREAETEGGVEASVRERGEGSRKGKAAALSTAVKTEEACSKTTTARASALLTTAQRRRPESEVLSPEEMTIPTPSTRRQQGSAAARAHCGPRLFYVCSDGTFLKGELFSVGSGSPYAYSVLDGGVRWGLSVAEACSLAREAVYRATHRDAYSGNYVDLYHVTAHGWRRREREDLKEEYYRERERERERVEERKRERERERVEQRKRERERERVEERRRERERERRSRQKKERGERAGLRIHAGRPSQVYGERSALGRIPEVKIQFLQGTDAFAFKFQHGVIVVVDSQATTASYIASQTEEGDRD
ncbi:hypothetical protein MATL_G00032600 [Megalops atlanticus]|uniref:Proteasome subunit beta type-11 n=1 Tax=Megalops atlanticus TaxID=7932 RepID=A0A9D3QE73_MEGAT|nr:hypothetical protein MATL_G00032600 [Megalops atlanticus]